MAFQLTSTAFSSGESIPIRHTCDGEDVSPPLQWGTPPEGTRSLALIADDPDAPTGTFVHWLIYDIPPDARGLPEGVATRDRVSEGLQGLNDFERPGYGGPCPPPGTPHRYYFTLRALDAPLDLEPGASRAQVDAACRGHVLAEAQLMGRFGR
jgi:Raf kinase inhibitor-like YbhB/YbcL family protein